MPSRQAVHLYRDKQAKARRRAKAKRDKAAGIKRKPKRVDAIGKMWGRLIPEVPFAAGIDGAGSAEMLGMVGLCLSRVWIMNRQSYLVGRLDANMMSRNQPEFWKLFKATLGIAGVAVVHRNIYKYVEAKLGVAWHEKLTHLMHSAYFKDMSYYHIAQKSAIGEGITDPDERITADCKVVARQMSLVFCEGLYTATAGVFFSLKLAQLYGARYAIGPYVYLWATFALTEKIAPVKWSVITRSLRDKFSSYREAVSRLVFNQEAVAALKGTEYEAKLIDEGLDTLMLEQEKFSTTVIWPGFVKRLGFEWFLRSFVALWVIGPHVYAPIVTDLSTMANISKLRGNIGHEFVLFIQSMIAAGLTAQILEKNKKISGNAERVHELLSNLEKMRQERRMNSTSKVKVGDCIEFSNVTIKTPTNRKLVEKLNFSLKAGESILLTGHNGAGKSSIFRCLGGLWSIPEGSITKPGSANSGLHQEVFYIPQKPYNVLGTLRDQLTYPESETGKDGKLVAEEVAMFERVGLGYLVTRPGALDTQINWEEELSLGEKQRLAMARLLYHKPKFAILDECTSAVSRQMEHTLYQICKELEITYITISHRPVLKAYHGMLLTIGEGDCGYTYVKIDQSKIDQKTLEFSASSVGGGSDQQDQAARKADTAIPSDDALGRMVALLQRSVPAAKIALPVAGIVSSVVVHAMLQIQLATHGAQMMSCVFLQDKNKFVREFGWSVLWNFCSAVVEQGTLYAQRSLQLDMRKGLMKNLQGRLLKNNNYYKISQLDGRITDPATRIADDVRDLTAMSAEMIAEVLKPVVELTFFLYKLKSLVGTGATAMLAAYLAAGATVLRLALPNFKYIGVKEAEEEGKLKLVHSRVRTHAESIAFFGGDARELELANKQFGSVMEVALKRLQLNWSFGMVNQAVIRETPMLAQWLLRNEHGKHFGDDAKIQADGGAALNSNMLFIYESVIYAFKSTANLLAFMERYANVSGLIVRVVELDEVLTSIDSADSGRNSIKSADDQSIHFAGVDIKTPTGNVLASKIDVSITDKTPIMVTGPNASGKTSFFRVLGGLWPAASGEVSAPCDPKTGVPGIKDIFLVPQRTYMVTGTLANQVTYPESVGKCSPELAEQLQALFEVVGIPGLPADKGGFDAVLRWEDVLSLGEQQRIGMARLFYNKPRFGVLDECTSAISVDVEEKLYREASNLGITCITLSQRLALNEFHTQELNLGSDNDNKWVVRAIAE